MKTLYIIDGNEGSIGKSLVSSLLYHMLIESGRTCWGIDSDAAQPTFAVQYGDAGVVHRAVRNDNDLAPIMSDIGKWALGKAGPEDVCMLDVGASQAERIAQSIVTSGLANRQFATKIRIRYVWVLGADKKGPAALKSIYPILSALPIDWTIVRNLRDGQPVIWEGSDLRQTMRSDRSDLREVEMPVFLGPREWIADGRAYPWSFFDTDKVYDVFDDPVLVSYLIDWRDQAVANIKASGIFK